MNKKIPLTSVILPAYNAELFIARTLDSVLSQTYKNIEVIVVDDGSQDTTADLVESYVKKDSRVILFRQPNLGVAAARNQAIAMSSGEYIAPIDADDIWYPQKLEKQMQRFQRSESSVGLVYAWSAYIDENDAIIGKYIPYYYWSVLRTEGNVYPILVYNNFIGNASAPLIRRSCFDKVGGYSTKLKELNAQGCEDWELYLRIAEYYQFSVVPEFLIGYRQVSESMSSGCNTMYRSYRIMIEDVLQRYPEVCNNLYHCSASHFCTYLAGKCHAVGDHWNNLYWLYQALRLDLSLLLIPWLYKTIVVCIVKIVAKPLTSLIWADHKSWLTFKNNITNLFNDKQVTSISEIQKQVEKYQLPWWQLHKIFQARKLSRTLEVARSLSYQYK